MKSSPINIKNRKASFEYEFLEKYTAGMVLTGTEIKSIRAGKANIAEGFCAVKNDELFARNLHIEEYTQGSYNNHEPRRDRKLLLNKNELKKLNTALQDKGLTVIPLRLFINEKGFAKLEIALARGKKTYDKRHSIKERDVERQVKRKYRV